MEIFLGLIAAWAYFSYRARKAKRKADQIYHKAYTDAMQELDAEQKEYEKMVLALPSIYGPGDFNIRVNTNSADKDILANYFELLEQEYTPNSEFNTILEHQKNHPNQKHAIRVEVGQGTMGYLYLDNNEEVCAELDKFGGKATCEGRLKKDSFTGLIELYIDLDIPLLISSQKQN